MLSIPLPLPFGLAPDPGLGLVVGLAQSLTFIMAASLATPATAYNIARDYSGSHFFNGWDYYGSWDNLTLSEYLLFALRWAGGDMYLQLAIVQLKR